MPRWLTVSLVHRARRIAIASSVRARGLCERYAKGVELDRLVAATNPHVGPRPPDSTSTSAISSATRIGWCNGRVITAVPIRIRSVMPAMGATIAIVLGRNP